LLFYSVDAVDLFRRAVTYVHRMLRGAKPAELPVQLPTKFEMVVNLKIAKALGLAVPPSILLRADEQIEQLVVMSGPGTWLRRPLGQHFRGNQSRSGHQTAHQARSRWFA